MSHYPLLDMAQAMRARRERSEFRARYFAELGRHLLRTRRALVEARGPGSFSPCEGCAWRAGLVCTSPRLKSNGGAGLAVTMASGTRAVPAAGLAGKIERFATALVCEGRAVVRAVETQKIGEG